MEKAGKLVAGKRERFSQEQKLKILEAAKEIGIKEAAKLIGIHYTTVYEWKKQLEARGKEGFLAYRSPSPGRGIKRITEAQETGVLDTWERYPGFGPSQIRGQLRRQGMTISTRSVQKIMEANGYEGIRKKHKEKDPQRFEASRPLELCQMDILEFFIHKLKVYLILLLDDHSRFILGWRLLDETSIDSVIGVVQDAIDRYGKMEEVLTDRGFVFYSWHGINRFERYLETEGIHHTHARPHHPQTLGKVEAVNKQIQKELIHRERFRSASDAGVAISGWVKIYNYERTHQGLGGFLVPGDRFHGREDQVIKDISEKIDPEAENCYAIPRSLINLVLAPEGKMTLYILGQPIEKIFGGKHEQGTESR
jgi:transposase InsO family protein